MARVGMAGVLVAGIMTIHVGAQAPPATPAPTDLIARIGRAILEPESAARTARLTKLTAELDALPAAALPQKVEGHFKLQVVDATVVRHARWLIDSAKTWDAPLRKKYAGRLVDSYLELARALLGEGANDEARHVLRGAVKDWPEAAASRAVAAWIARTDLIGTPAAPLTAPRWLNMPPATTTLDLKGKVTLIEFSAHWCGPCAASYPALHRFRSAYGPRGFQAVIVTELYGYFGTDKGITPEDELARDRAYFAKHKVALPVAIGNQPASPARDQNKVNYRADNGLPQFYLVDRQGRIRFLLDGYGSGSEAKLSKLIRRLLAEQ